MPYAYDPNRREEDDPNNPQGPQVAGSGQLFGGGGETTGSGAVATSKPTDSGRFQNLNSYLDANQDSQFGTQFADKVNTDVNAAGAAQVQGQQSFKDTVDKSVVKQDKGLVDSAISDPYEYLYGGNGAAGGSETSYNADGTPKAQTTNATTPFGGKASDSETADRLGKFQSQYNAAYKGPSQYSDNQDAYQKAAGATQKAQDVSQAAQSEPGRFALLDNYFGQNSGRQGDYTQGQKGLDNLLVQGDRGAQDSLAQARANAQGSAANFEGQKKDLSNYAAQGRGQTEATQNYAREKLGTDKTGNLAATGAVPDYLKGLDASVTQRQADAGTDFAALKTALSKANNLKGLNSDQVKALGLASNSGVTANSPDFKVQDPNSRFTVNPSYGTGNSSFGSDSFFGLDPSQYASQVSASNINRGSVQTAEQARKLKALESLGGLSSQVSNPDDAGKYSSGSLAQFDSAQFNTKLANERNAAQSGFNALRDQYQPIATELQAGNTSSSKTLPYYAGTSWKAGQGETQAQGSARQNMEARGNASKAYEKDLAALKAKYKL